MSGAVQSAVTAAGRGCVAALALALVLHGSTKRPPARHQSAAPPAPSAVRTAPSVAPVPGIPDQPEVPPGMCAATDGWAAAVEPTASSGEVVVEAAFGSDSPIQPRFVLPIVSARVLPVRAFVVSSNYVSRSSILGEIDYANSIYSQVGIKLTLMGVQNHIGLDSDFIVSVFDTRTNNFGQVRKCLSQQAMRIMDTYKAGDCLEIYFVNQIVNGKAVAFRTKQGIIVSNRATDHVVAHEIGHCLGLQDCYVQRRQPGGEFVWLNRHDEPIDDEFMRRPRDFGAETGRGFTERTDSRERVIYNFLMYGVDGRGGVDIPSADVLSLRKYATDEFGTKRSAIGADYIKENDKEVLSQ